jgi:hypothetical protein
MILVFPAPLGPSKTILWRRGFTATRDIFRKTDSQKNREESVLVARKFEKREYQMKNKLLGCTGQRPLGRVSGKCSQGDGCHAVLLNPVIR